MGASLWPAPVVPRGVLGDFVNLDPTTRWLLVVAIALTLFYAVMRSGKKRRDPLQKSPPLSLATQRSVERDMNNLLVELSKMARELTAHIETRAAKLEILLKEADEKIVELKNLGAASTHATGNGNGQPQAEPAPVQEQPAVPKSDPERDEIYRLADQNLSAQQIAGRLSRPDGEVELILRLRKERA